MKNPIFARIAANRMNNSVKRGGNCRPKRRMERKNYITIMYFAYIDESGNLNKDNLKSQEYVLTAFIIHEKYWFDFQRACEDLKFDIWQMLEKNQTYMPPDDFELQADEAFDPREMKRLFELGHELGLAGSAWRDTPP